MSSGRIRPWEVTPRKIRHLVIDGLRDDAALLRDSAACGRPDPDGFLERVADGYDALRVLLVRVEALPYGAIRMADLSRHDTDPYDPIWGQR